MEDLVFLRPVATMTTPPPVPQYWHFATVFTDHSGNVRKRIATMCSALQLDICYQQPWVWYIQLGQDSVECNVFRQEEHVVVDVNLLHGDRWRYWKTIADMKAHWYSNHSAL